MELTQEQRGRLEIVQTKSLLAQSQAMVAQLQQEVDSLKLLIELSDQTGIPVSSITVQNGVVIDARPVEVETVGDSSPTVADD